MLTRFCAQWILATTAAWSLVSFTGVEAAAADTPLFANGPFAFAGGLGIGSRIATDDFVLDEAATVARASFVYYNTSATGGALGPVIEWYVYSDVGGMPGPLIASGAGEILSDEHLGRYDNWEAFSITIGLDQPVLLEGQVVYRFGLQNPGGVLPVARHWGGADMSNGNSYYRFPPDGEWTFARVEMSFQLLPEPSAPLLGCSALLSLAALALRQRRSSIPRPHSPIR